MANVVEVVLLSLCHCFNSLAEMLTLETIKRFCDYLFEKEVIDDEGEFYQLSETFANSSDELVQLLYEITQFR